VKCNDNSLVVSSASEHDCSTRWAKLIDQTQFVLCTNLKQA